MPLTNAVVESDADSGLSVSDIGDGVPRTVFDMNDPPGYTDGPDATHAWEHHLGPEPFMFSIAILPTAEITLSGNLTLTADSPTYLFFDCADSARTVTTPTEVSGMCYVIMNIGDGAETLTINDSGASEITTVAVDAFVTIVYSGSAWRVF